MPTDKDLLDRLIDGDRHAPAEVLDRARIGGSPALLVAAALLTPRADDLLDRAARAATTTRDRQLTALAAARLAHDDRLDALVRDHLADHPDSALASWIATRPDPDPGPPEPVTADDATHPTTPHP